MSFSLDINNNTRGLNNLDKYDIIEYNSDRVSRGNFMILQVEKNEKIPALLLQLWRFDGGYDHTVVNIMENDLGLNKQVPFFEPKVEQGKILSITSYRDENNELSKKELFLFDVWPDNESPHQTDACSIPFRVEVSLGGKTKELILPRWTPLQRIPLDRISPGAIVETWTVESHTQIMKVLQL